MLGARLAVAPSASALLLALVGGYFVGRLSNGPPASVLFWASTPRDEASNPRQTIFDELTASETRVVAAYVLEHFPGVKTSMFPDGMPDGDYISGTSAVELIAPKKAAALVR